jgi:hypothetical protein
MSYEKPLVALIASAVETIKNVNVKGIGDSQDSTDYFTEPAYEADE